MLIRKMTEEDIPYVAALEGQIFSDPWSEKLYRETMVLSGVEYVVVIDETSEDRPIVGAGGVRNIVGTGEITNVMITPLYRRKGYARQMLLELIERGRKLGARDFTLEVRKSNTGAASLYESIGFVSAGIRPGFYSNPKEDAVIYWLYEDKNKDKITDVR